MPQVRSRSWLEEQGSTTPSEPAIAPSGFAAAAAGDLAAHPPARVMLGLAFDRKTGALRFERGEAEVRTVYFEDGVIVNGFPNAFDATVTVGTPGDPVTDFTLLDMNFFVDNVVGFLG